MDYELQSQLLVNALKEAEGQRAVRMPEAKMQGNYAILPGAGNTLDAGLNRILGNWQKPQIEQQMADLRGQERGDYDRLLKELTTPGMRQVQDNSSPMGPLPEPVTRNAPLSPVDESRRRLNVYGQMSRLPMAKAMADKGIASEVDFPEKQALREQAIEGAREQQRQRGEDQFRTDRARAEDRNTQIQMQLEGRKDLARLAASLRPAPAAPAGKTQIAYGPDGKGYLVDMTTGEQRPLGDVGKPAKAPTKAEEQQKKLNAAPAMIDTIMKEAEGNREAFGIVPAATTMLPNIIGSRVMSKVLTPDQQKARIKVQSQAAKVIHDVYGAALSRNEAFRAEGWAPDPRDDYDTTMRKLQGAKEYAQIVAGGGEEPAAPTGGISDDDLLKKYGSGK